MELRNYNRGDLKLRIYIPCGELWTTKDWQMSGQMPHEEQPAEGVHN